MGNLDKKGSAVFYESFYDSTKDLDDKTFREAWSALMEYAFYDEEPEDISPISAMFFKMAKPNIDKAFQLRENGKGGGRPKKPLVSDEKPMVSSKKPMVSEVKTKHIYDVDVDVDVDVDEDVDVDVVTPAGGQTDTQHTDTQVSHPENNEIVQEIAAKGYKMDGASIQAFIEYNDQRGWKMDWRKALKRWADRERPPERKTPAGKFANFPQRDDQEQRDLVAEVIKKSTGG